MASSPSLPNSSRRQRDRIVGSNRPGAWLTRKNNRIGRRLLEHLEQRIGGRRFKIVDASITIARHGLIDGVTASNSPRERTWSTLMLRARPPVGRSRAAPASGNRDGCPPPSAWRSDARSAFPAPAGQSAVPPPPPAPASPLLARSSPCPRPSARQAARHGAAAAMPRRCGTASTALSCPTIMAAGRPTHTAAAAVTVLQLPAASISLTRSGSLPAISRNPASTCRMIAWRTRTDPVAMSIPVARPRSALRLRQA